jgi:hypothetical protein
MSTTTMPTARSSLTSRTVMATAARSAHVRPANPRDSLAPVPADSTIVSNRHRLLRRGRTYGKPVAEAMEAEDILAADDYAGERGLHFVCPNTPKFEVMYNDVDAIAGDHDKRNAGYITIPAEPVRRRVPDVPRFVHTRRGASPSWPRC